MTPHIEAKKEDIAKIVIMPGDPLRAKFIAENYLKDYKLVNEVRNMFAYTGYYKDKRITVMGSGMGIPSMGIYSYELFKIYDVDLIIRIGSCGAMIPDLKLFDIVLCEKAFSLSGYANVFSGTNDKIIEASKELSDKIENTAKVNNIKVYRGNIYTSEVFTPYQMIDDPKEAIKNNCIASEMEAFALFHNAKVLGKKAACLATVADSPFFKEEVSIDERQTSLTKMIELGLESIL